MARLSLSVRFKRFDKTQWLAALLLVIGLLLLALLRVALKHLPVEAQQQPTLDVWLRVWLFFFLVLFLVCRRVKSVNLRGALLSITLGFFLAGIVILGLNGTPYALNGDHGDQGMLTAQVTKFAAHANLVDFAYKGLPAFYPPLYPYLLGRLSTLLPIAPYETLKYGLIGVAFLLPFLTQRLWTAVVDDDAALWLAFAALLYQDWYKPAEWLSLFLFLPWWLTFVEGLRRKERPHNIGLYLLGGFLGALLFQLYYYWFFVGGLSLFTRRLLQRLSLFAREAKAPRLRDQLLMLASTALFSALYLLPLLFSALRAGGLESLQNRYFQFEFARIDFLLNNGTLTGLLLLGGLGYLLLHFRQLPLIRALLNLIIAAYLWQFLGFFSYLLNLPLLVSKTQELITYLLLIAALLGLRELWRSRDRWQSGGQSVQALAAGVLVLGMLYFGQAALDTFSHSPLRAGAYGAQFPQSLVDSYRKVTNNHPVDTVVLDGAGPDLIMYLPVYEVLGWAAHFSHPAALFHERAAFLKKLSELDNPQLFAAALMNSRYDHIDQVLLTFTGDGYLYTYSDDNFPNGAQRISILFPASLFDNEYFARSKGDDWVFFTPEYANDPLQSLIDQVGYYDGSEDSSLLPISQQSFYNFLLAFGPYMQFDNQAALLQHLSEVLTSSQ